MDIKTKYNPGQKIYYFEIQSPGEIELVETTISRIFIDVYLDNSYGITYILEDDKKMKDVFLFSNRRDAYSYIKSIFSKNFRIKLTDDIEDELPEPEKVNEYDEANNLIGYEVNTEYDETGRMIYRALKRRRNVYEDYNDEDYNWK